MVGTQFHLCAAETPGRRGVCGFQGSGGGRRLHPVVQRALVRRAAAVGSALGWSHRLSGKHTSYHTVVDAVEEEEEECVITAVPQQKTRGPFYKAEN